MENNLKEKILSVFEDASIDKNLYSSSGLNEQSIPVFVGEWLIDRELKGGDWDDDVKEKVLGFVSKYIPKKSDIELLKSKLKNGENVTILEFISPKVDLKKNETYVESSSLGNQKVFIEEQLLDQFPRLLQGGLWGAAVYNYQVADKGGEVWLQNFVPLQASQIDFDKYAKQRLEFSLEEWIAILINSIGLNPDGYSTDKIKQVLLTRLLPFVQKRINLFELAPKGTGKSFVFGNFSRYSRLVTGSISPAVLFYNENSKAPGLLTQFDAVVFDEAQSLSFSNPAVTVSNLKTYLESGKYAKGKFESTADSGAVFIANVQMDSSGLPVNSKNLFRELPQILQETAFIDRIHGIIQGWELPRIETSTLSNGMGFKADFIGEIFHALRSRVEFDKFVEERSNLIGTKDLRDKKAIMKMASGFLKLLFPNLTTVTESDPEFKNYIINVVDQKSQYQNLEKVLIEESDEILNSPEIKVSKSTRVLEIKEGDLGYSYEILFSPFFELSKEIKLVDPFIRLSYQIDNFLAFCKLLPTFKIKNLHLITSTGSDDDDDDQLRKNRIKFEEIKMVLLKKGIVFEYEFSETIHDRYIETDNGWKITLGRGIDIFQRPESWYDLDRDDLTKRKCRATIISYNKI
jgi:ATP-dependent Lon protease